MKSTKSQRSRAPQPTARATSASTSTTRGILLVLLVVSLAANGFLLSKLRHPAPPPPAPPLSTDLVPYAALGSLHAENNRIRDLRWTEPQFAAFVEGLRASYEGRGYPQDDASQKLRAAINERVQQMIDAEQPDPTEGYFRMLREQENVQRTASGLHYRITQQGEGTQPRVGDTIVVSYAARTPDGKTLSALAGERLRVGVTDLLPGLAEGVQLLKPGGKALFYLATPLSFGSGEWPKDVPRGMPIGFFFELHEVIPP